MGIARDLPYESLCLLFVYDPLTGIVAPLSGKRYLNSGKNASERYFRFQIDGKKYRVHRIAWILYHKSAIPDGYQIDHINGIGKDNRIVNLRLVTARGNAQNRKRHRSGRLVGYRVSKYGSKPYQGLYKENGRQTTIGWFSSASEANAAYLKCCELGSAKAYFEWCVKKGEVSSKST